MHIPSLQQMAKFLFWSPKVACTLKKSYCLSDSIVFIHFNITVNSSEKTNKIYQKTLCAQETSGHAVGFNSIKLHVMV